MGGTTDDTPCHKVVRRIETDVYSPINKWKAPHALHKKGPGSKGLAPLPRHIPRRIDVWAML